MLKDDVLKLGFTEEQIAIYLPQPKIRKVKKQSDDGRSVSVAQLHYDDKAVYQIVKHLQRTTVNMG